VVVGGIGGMALWGKKKSRNKKRAGLRPRLKACRVVDRKETPVVDKAGGVKPRRGNITEAERARSDAGTKNGRHEKNERRGDQDARPGKTLHS